MSEGYLLATRIVSVTIICFGLVIVVVTVAGGGGPLSTGFLFGILFTALGAGRLFLAVRP